MMLMVALSTAIEWLKAVEVISKLIRYFSHLKYVLPCSRLKYGLGHLRLRFFGCLSVYDVCLKFPQQTLKIVHFIEIAYQI